MKYIIAESSVESIIQDLITSEFDNIREMSEEWGLGEMDEIHEVESINKLKVNHVQKKDSTFYVYIDIITNYPRDNFENVITSIEYELSNWFPSVEIIVDNIY